MIVIVDYGLGNLGSVANMLRKLGVPARISAGRDEIAAADALILPGVGHFDTGMRNLRERGLVQSLNEAVIQGKKPILGICLGAQLFARSSEEGTAPGLGWIAARVKRFAFGKDSPLVVPHMGWNETEPVEQALFSAVHRSPPRFYFVHSFHLDVESAADVAAWATYGYRFPAVIRSGNVVGAQFHPEKSHRYGMAFLRAWLAGVGHAA